MTNGNLIPKYSKGDTVYVKGRHDWGEKKPIKCTIYAIFYWNNPNRIAYRLRSGPFFFTRIEKHVHQTLAEVEATPGKR